jgi:Uncharacterized protein conserved in bacteria
MEKFVIWGIGLRGKRVFNFLNRYQIEAIIESNSELVGTVYNGVPIVDFETYCKKYSEYYLIITPLYCEKILTVLYDRGIFRFFMLSECQAELQYGGHEFPITEYPITIKPQETYVIYGLTLWSILLYQFLSKNECRKISILPHPGTDKRIICDLADKLNLINLESDKMTCNRLMIAVEDQEKLFRKVLTGDYIIENMHDLSDCFEVYQNEEIKAFKNIYTSKRCFIIGNGPSLQMRDLDRLWGQKEICFGCNRIYLTQKDTIWRPNYYVAEDRKCLLTCAKEILAYKCDVKFIGDTYLPFWTCDMPVRNIHKYHCHTEFLRDGRNHFCRVPKFSNDISRKSYSIYTVVYTCLQFAVYMGFKEIYLLGVDCNYAVNADYIVDASNQNHFSKNYESGLENQMLRADTEGMVFAFTSAKKHADEHGIKIYNATRGGKLEVFERVDFDSLFR